MTLLERATSQILTAAPFRFREGYLNTLLQPNQTSKTLIELWPSQINSIKAGALNRPSFVISMPTSSGKTLLAELKILDYLERHPDGLAVYIAPYVALATQVRNELDQRIVAAGFDAPQVWTGAFEIDNFALFEANVLVMTPEKLDSVLRNRKLGDERAIRVFQRLGLVIVDETHMIGSKGRGLSLELFISRLINSKPEALDVFAMSAVIENIKPVATWAAGSAAFCHVDDWKPTDRRCFYLKRDGRLLTLPKFKDSGLRLEAWTKPKTAVACVAKAFVDSGAYPILVLESQRAYAESAASSISRALDNSEMENADVLAARESAGVLVSRFLGKTHALRKLLKLGIAYHHAGLPQELCSEIESLAKKGQLRVVCATTTLAEGVDLPFRSAIVPHVFLADQQLMPLSLLQNILGRAGRADVSVSGTAVILEPGPSVAQFAENTLLRHVGERAVLSSNLHGLKLKPYTHEDWDHNLRVQAQLTGLLSDESFGDDQAIGFAESTFAAVCDESSIQSLADRFTPMLEKASVC